MTPKEKSRQKLLWFSFWFTVKRNGNEIFSAGSDGNSDGLRLIMNNLPTSDPSVAGQLWNNSGAVSISAG